MNTVRLADPTMLSRRARRLLRSARQRGTTGLLLDARIRGCKWSRFRPRVSVHVSEEGRGVLGWCSVFTKRPKWVDLEPGTHHLRLGLMRPRVPRSFRRKVDLGPGQILLVVCHPDRRPASGDRWYIGLVGSSRRSSPGMLPRKSG